jgi:hypothetical protein
MSVTPSEVQRSKKVTPMAGIPTIVDSTVIITNDTVQTTTVAARRSLRDYSKHYEDTSTM